MNISRFSVSVNNKMYSLTSATCTEMIRYAFYIVL